MYTLCLVDIDLAKPIHYEVVCMSGLHSLPQRNRGEIGWLGLFNIKSNPIQKVSGDGVRSLVHTLTRKHTRARIHP